MALNAQQVAGVKADRELPVVWAVCKGSFVNKAILVPGALLLSAVGPWAISPLLTAGGVFLCFEGFEKVAHRLLSSRADSAAEHARLLQVLADASADVVALEREKIKGAVRTDFILSIEIIVITLGTVQSSALLTQLSVLAGVAVLMTAGVYGLVACIVKLDDLGLYLSRQGVGAGTAPLRAVGRALLNAAPALMKTLALLGTLAMFLVGGGILAHGVPAVGRGTALWSQSAGAMMQPLAALVLNTLLGVLAGGVALLGVTLVQRIKARLFK